MNERIKELAKQAGINSPDGFKLTVNHMAIFTLEAFAALVEAAARADEREKCAQVAEQWLGRSGYRELHIAEDIRARGTT
jgi:hypothetical protein